MCAIDPWSQGLDWSGLALRDGQRRQEGMGKEYGQVRGGCWQSG